MDIQLNNNPIMVLLVLFASLMGKFCQDRSQFYGSIVKSPYTEEETFILDTVVYSIPESQNTVTIIEPWYDHSQLLNW